MLWQEGAGEATPQGRKWPLRPRGWLLPPCFAPEAPATPVPSSSALAQPCRDTVGITLCCLIKATYSQGVKYSPNIIQRKGRHRYASMETIVAENPDLWWRWAGVGGGVARRFQLYLYVCRMATFPRPPNRIVLSLDFSPVPAVFSSAGYV